MDTNISAQFFASDAKRKGWDGSKVVQTLNGKLDESERALYRSLKRSGAELRPVIGRIIGSMKHHVNTAVSSNDPSLRPMDRDRFKTVSVCTLFLSISYQ